MFVHVWPAFLAKIPNFGILVNILVTKILILSSKRLIFGTNILLGANIQLVNFHDNRLTGMVARAHKRIDYLYS